jgi:hypothetical protein
MFQKRTLALQALVTVATTVTDVANVAADVVSRLTAGCSSWFGAFGALDVMWHQNYMYSQFLFFALLLVLF